MKKSMITVSERKNVLRNIEDLCFRIKLTKARSKETVAKIKKYGSKDNYKFRVQFVDESRKLRGLKSYMADMIRPFDNSLNLLSVTNERM